MSKPVRLSVAVETMQGAPHLVLSNVGEETARDLLIYLRDVENHQDWTGLLSRPRCWILPAGQQASFRIRPQGPRVLEVEVIYYDRAGTRGFWLSRVELERRVSDDAPLADSAPPTERREATRARQLQDTEHPPDASPGRN